MMHDGIAGATHRPARTVLIKKEVRYDLVEFTIFAGGMPLKFKKLGDSSSAIELLSDSAVQHLSYLNPSAE